MMNICCLLLLIMQLLLLERPSFCFHGKHSSYFSLVCVSRSELCWALKSSSSPYSWKFPKNHYPNTFTWLRDGRKGNKLTDIHQNGEVSLKAFRTRFLILFYWINLNASYAKRSHVSLSSYPRTKCRAVERQVIMPSQSRRKLISTA